MASIGAFEEDTPARLSTRQVAVPTGHCTSETFPFKNVTLRSLYT